jgi:hypothetical protein
MLARVCLNHHLQVYRVHPTATNASCLDVVTIVERMPPTQGMVAQTLVVHETVTIVIRVINRVNDDIKHVTVFLITISI